MRAAWAAALALFAALPTQAAEPAPFPLPLEARVDLAPTAFPGAGKIHLVYELRLTNHGAEPLTLDRIEAFDDRTPGQPPLGVVGGRELEAAIKPIGPAPAGPAVVPAGGTAVVFMGLTFEPAAGPPPRLRHRLTTSGGEVSGAATSIRLTGLKTLGPPLAGGPWLAGDGPGNGPNNHHRRGLMVVDGRATISRRFAIDWQKVQGGKVFGDDEHDVRAYYGYGAPLLAVADGRVVAARDGLPDNRPGHGRDFQPATPITLDTEPGNRVVLDLGQGQFAHYMHLKPGSLTVKAGDRVRRGQVIGQVGSSGDSREPHLHFEVTDSATPLAGEGLPYLIDRYRVMATDGGTPRSAARALPLDGEAVDFDR